MSSHYGRQGRGEAGPVHLPGPDHPLVTTPPLTRPNTVTSPPTAISTNHTGAHCSRPWPLVTCPLRAPPARAPGLWGPPPLHPWASPSRSPLQRTNSWDDSLWKRVPGQEPPWVTIPHSDCPVTLPVTLTASEWGGEKPGPSMGGAERGTGVSGHSALTGPLAVEHYDVASFWSPQPGSS